MAGSPSPVAAANYLHPMVHRIFSYAEMKSNGRSPAKRHPPFPTRMGTSNRSTFLSSLHDDAMKGVHHPYSVVLSVKPSIEARYRSGKVCQPQPSQFRGAPARCAARAASEIRGIEGEVAIWIHETCSYAGKDTNAQVCHSLLEGRQE